MIGILDNQVDYRTAATKNETEDDGKKDETPSK